ncbi:MAG: hypothetical protein WCJ02_16870 [bacterium]
MRTIHLANEKKRDAEVGFEMNRAQPRATYVLKSGKSYESIRILKSTFATELEAIQKSDADVAAAIESGDPEIDMELSGRKLDTLSKVYLAPDGKVAYGVKLMEHVHAPDGTEKEIRELTDTPANIALDNLPIRWTGKMFPKAAALRKFVFARSYQFHHINGLTYDFLFEMAKKLDESKSMMLVGGGDKGVGPLVFANNGSSYRGFLEGRVKGEKYILILHLTNLELKEIPNA